MMKAGIILFTHLASIATFIGLYVAVSSLPSLSSMHPAYLWVLIVVIIFNAGVAIFEVFDFFKTRPKKYKSKDKINLYMCKWISSGGRVAIFSRDMSWADGEKVRDILKDKAIKNELTICVEKNIQLTDELRKNGAKIVTYDHLSHIPRSRFTIVDFDREGARVAVGLHEDGKHSIHEFRSGHHPIFAVAEDMVKFLAAANGVTGNVSSNRK